MKKSLSLLLLLPLWAIIIFSTGASAEPPTTVTENPDAQEINATEDASEAVAVSDTNSNDAESRAQKLAVPQTETQKAETQEPETQELENSIPPTEQKAESETPASDLPIGLIIVAGVLVAVLIAAYFMFVKNKTLFKKEESPKDKPEQSEQQPCKEQGKKSDADKFDAFLTLIEKWSIKRNDDTEKIIEEIKKNLDSNKDKPKKKLNPKNNPKNKAGKELCEALGLELKDASNHSLLLDKAKELLAEYKSQPTVAEEDNQDEKDRKEECQTSDSKEPDTSDDVKTPENEKSEEELQKELTDELDTLISGYNSLSTKEKIERIKGIIKADKDLRSEKDKLAKENESLNEKVNTAKGVFKPIINEIKKDNERFSNANGKGEGKDERTIIEYIKLLTDEISDYKESLEQPASQSSIADSGIKISDLNNIDNEDNVRRRLIDKLEEAGISPENRNSLSELFGEIKDWHTRYKQGSKDSIIKKAVEDTVNDGSFSEEQKNRLLARLVERLNERLGDDDKVDVSDVGEFISHIVAKIATPADVRQAVDKEREDLLQKINDEVGDLNVEDFDKAILEFKVCRIAKEERSEILRKYGAESLAKLPQKIVKKDFDEKIEECKEQLEAVGSVNSIKDLVNKFGKKLTDAADARKRAEDAKAEIVDALDEKISALDKNYNADAVKEAAKLDIYIGIRDGKERELNRTISNKEGEIDRLNGTISQKATEIAALTADRDELMKTSGEMVEMLHASAERVIEASTAEIISSCGEDSGQSERLEERMRKKVQTQMNALKNFTVGKDMKPAATKEEIRKRLREILDADDSAVNLLGQYYAYSRLPFMTDSRDDNGVRFNRFAMSELYDAIDKLFVVFGIKLNVPLLFVAGFGEGNFEISNEMSNLNFLCPNATNHAHNIDSGSVPENLLVDIVKVGYSLDGEEVRLPEVIII